MGWFSKSTDGFFRSTTTPPGIDFDCEVMGETNGMMMVAVSGTAVKL